jgi:multiple sugar transport system ATP-binding protein
MVFQDYALYPHMSVRQNIGFGLKMRDTPRAKIAAAVEKVADILQIQALLDRKPKALSGGQRQRVAIGRAIAREPALFLFDEPLSNLDAKLRVEMRTQIKRLHMAFKATSVYVTHDQTEAMTLADRIVALRDGRIEQVGSPDDLYARPANRFVAGFIGSPTMNFLDASLAAEGDGLVVDLPGGTRLPVPAARAQRYSPHAGRPVVLGIRPEDLTNTWTEASRDGAGILPLELPVEIAEPLGSDTLVFSRIGESEIVCRLSAVPAPATGSTMRVHAHLNHMHLFDPATGAAL